MAERKIPYIIELAADDKKLRSQMSGWNWEEIMGQSKGKSFKDILVKDTKEAKQEMISTLGSMGLDWGKILGEKELGLLEKKIGKIIKANQDKLSFFANEGDTEGIQKTIDLVSALGNELKGLGSNFDASGIARNINAFMKVLTPISAKMEQLAKEPEKVAAAFDRMFSGAATDGAVKVAQGFTIIGDEAGKAAVKTNQAIKDMEKHLSSIDALFDKEYSIKFDSDMDKQFTTIEKEISSTSKEIKKIIADMENMSTSDDNFESTRNKLVEKYKHQAELYRSKMLINEKYTSIYPEDKSLLMKDNKAYEKQINTIKGKISLLVQDAYRQLDDLSKSTKTTNDGINIPIKIPTQNDLVKTINQYIDGINKSKAIHSIKIDIDKTLGSSTNPIEDVTKRGYKDNPTDEDAATTELLNKTNNRFIQVAKTIGKKQKGILENTQKWRKSMIKAMQIGKDDLNFQFGWEGHLESSADSLFNQLQEYFERPENALNLYFNTKNIAQNLKNQLNAEGITINGGGGAVTLDTDNLESIISSILLGKTSSGATTSGRGITANNANVISSSVSNETKEAVSSTEEYVAVLDQTTIHIDKVIQSLREFAKVATKSNASKGAKKIAEDLSHRGLDINKIASGTDDISIIKMLQTSFMAKDDMGHAQGSSLVGELQSMMSTYKMKPTSGAGKVVDILTQDIVELFNINNIETELVEQVQKRLDQFSLWKDFEKPGRALAALGNVRSTKKAIKIPSFEDFDKAIRHFKAAGEDVKSLETFKQAREELGFDESEEAKQKFEQAARTFYQESEAVFNRLRKKTSLFRGVVYPEGRKPVTIDPKGAYPRKMLEIPEDAVISKVLPYEPNITLNEDDFSGNYNRRQRQEKQLYRGSSGYDFTVDKLTPNQNVRWKEIDYQSFTTQEKMPPNISAELKGLSKYVEQVPELTQRIEEGQKIIVDLANTKKQLEQDIEHLTIEDVPNIKLNTFKQYADPKPVIDNIVKDAGSALKTNSSLTVGNKSSLTQAQSDLVGRLQHVINGIQSDSEASQKLANQISEIEKAQKLSKEELEHLRIQAANVLGFQNTKKIAQQEIKSLMSNTDIDDNARELLISQQQSRIDSADKSLTPLMELFKGRTIDPNFYKDLIFDKSTVEQRLAKHKTQKSEIDGRLDKNKGYAQALIDQLNTINSTNDSQATQEAEQLATQLVEVKERLYAEAASYVKILNGKNVDQNTYQTTLGKLQQTLGALDNSQNSFSEIQSYVPNTSFYTNAQAKNVGEWTKNYSDKEVRRLEEELKTLTQQLSKETEQTKADELKKQIANTKRSLTMAKKRNPPQDVLKTKQAHLSKTESQIAQEQSVLKVNESNLRIAESESRKFHDKSADIEFLTAYNELLSKEKTLLEEVNKLKNEGADASAISAKTNELRQATQETDNFLQANKNDKRSAYAREEAIKYQALLSTAKRQRGAFDSDMTRLEEDENSINTYGMTGQAGARAMRIAKSQATYEYMASDYVKEVFDTLRAKTIAAIEEGGDKDALWKQYDIDKAELTESLKTNFKNAFDVKDGVFNAVFKTKDIEGNWIDDVKTYNVKDTALSSIATSKNIVKQNRAPLDDIIADLEMQKKTAMRYGAISNEDLVYDDRLKEIERLNEEINNKQAKLQSLENELARIQGNDSLDEKDRSKEIKSKQKEIENLNQEINMLEDRVQNRTELISRQVQEKEDSRPTTEEKVANATEKLSTQKERLAQIEEKIAQRRAEYEGAKGTENEMRTLELLDNEIKKRDELLGKIKATEDNITRWDAQIEEKNQMSYSTGGEMPEGGLIGGILSQVMSKIEGLDIGSDINTEELAKETTLQAILQVLGGVPSGNDDYGLGRGRKATNLDNVWKEIPTYNNATTDIDTLRNKAGELKTTLDTLYDEGKTDTVDFLKAQTELSRVLTLLRNKISKDDPNVYGEKGNKESAKTAQEYWKSYLTSGDSKLFDNLDNVSLSSMNKAKFNSALKKINGTGNNLSDEKSQSKEPVPVKTLEQLTQTLQTLENDIKAKTGDEKQQLQASFVKTLSDWSKNEASGLGGKSLNSKEWQSYLIDNGIFDKIDTSITPLTNRQLNKGSKIQEPVPVKVTETKTEKTSTSETKSSQQTTNKQVTGGLIQIVSQLAKESTLLQVLGALQTVGTTEGGHIAPTAAGDLYSQFKALLLGSSIDDHERLAFMNSESGALSGNVIGNIANISKELMNALRAKYPSVQGFDTQIHTHGKDNGSYFSKEDYRQFASDYESGIKKQVLLTQDHVSVLDLTAVKSAEEVKELMNELAQAGKKAQAIKKIFENDKSGATFKSVKLDSLNAESLVNMLGTTTGSGNNGVKNKKSYSGVSAVDSVNNQKNKIIGMLGTEDNFNNSDIAMVQNYNKAVKDLNTTYQNLIKNGQLQDEQQQQALSQQSYQVQVLGKHLLSNINQAAQLKQYVEQTGTYTNAKGDIMPLGGSTDKLSVDEVKNLESTMRNYVQKTLKQANIENVKFNSTKQQLIYTFRTSKDTVADMVVQYNNATNALYAYNKQERESLTGMKAFIQGFQSKLKSITQYMFSITSITRVWSEIRRGIQYVREIDSALTELKKVTDETEESYDRFLDTAAKTADKVGSTIQEIVNSTADWARLGYSMEEAAKLAETTSVLLNVSEFSSIDEATSALTSTMQAFGYTADQSMYVVDVLNEVGKLVARR